MCQLNTANEMNTHSSSASFVICVSLVCEFQAVLSLECVYGSGEGSFPFTTGPNPVDAMLRLCFVALNG